MVLLLGGRIGRGAVVAPLERLPIMTSKSKKHLRGMSRSEIGIGDLKNPRDDHRPKSEGFFARAKVSNF